MNHIPVLMYHRVCNDGEGEPSLFTVDKSSFKRQLQFCADHGFVTRPLDELLNCRNQNSSSKKSLVITFDDGYVDTLELAAPLLKEFGFSATVFILPDFSRRTNWWDTSKGIQEAPLMEPHQVVALQKMGFGIGSHGWSHRSLPWLNDEELADEFRRSKKATEELLGQPIHYFAYPYGDVDERVKAAAREANFRCAFATNSGPMSFHADLFQIRRTNMPNRSDNSFLYTKLFGVEKLVRTGWSLAKNVIGKDSRGSKS